VSICFPRWEVDRHTPRGGALAAAEDPGGELGDRHGDELGSERHDAQRDRERGGGRGAGQADDEHRVARAEAGRQQRQQHARDPRQREGAEQDERAGGRAAEQPMGEQRDPGGGRRPAREVDRDHLRERALAQRPGDHDAAPGSQRARRSPSQAGRSAT
jgi:hypothetical protein